MSLWWPLLGSLSWCPVLKSSHWGAILFMCTTNEIQRCNVTSSLIDWAQTQNNPWSLQPIWRSSTRRWNLQVPDLQMSCFMRGYKDNSYTKGCALVIQVKSFAYKWTDLLLITWMPITSDGTQTAPLSQNRYGWMKTVLIFTAIFLNLLTGNTFEKVSEKDDLSKKGKDFYEACH